MSRGLMVGAPQRRLALVCLAVMVSSALMLLRRPEWEGSLSTAASQFTGSSLLGAPVVAGAAAWLHGRPRRWGLGEWVSVTPRGDPGRRLTTVLVVAAVGAVGLVVPAVVIVARCLASGALLAPLASYTWLVVVAMVAAMVVWAGWGAALGETLPGWLAVPVATLTTYAVHVVFVVYLAESALGSLAIYQAEYWTYVTRTPMELGVLCGFWASAAAWVVLRATSHRGLRVVAAGCASVAGSLAILTGAPPVGLAGASDPVCTSSTVLPVCADRAHAAVLEEYAGAVDGLVRDTPQPLRPRAVFMTEAVRGGRAGLVLEPSNGGAAPAYVLDRTELVARYGEEIFMGACRQDVPTSSLAAYLPWLRAHGVRGLGPLRTGGPAAANLPGFPAALAESSQIDGLAPAERDDWFAQVAPALIGCTPGRPPRAAP